MTRPESLLILLQGDRPEVHPGIVDGYDRLRVGGGLTDLEVLPVFGPKGAGRGQPFWDDVRAAARGIDASALLLEYYHDPALPDPRPAIARLRADNPDLFVVATLGDAFMNGLRGRPDVPRSFLRAAEVADLVMLSSMGALADHVAGYTGAPILLYPNAVCQVRFEPPVPRAQDVAPEFDVVFIGSRNAPRNPLRPYRRFGLRRTALVDALTSRFGTRFAVFGHGWEDKASNQGPVPFDQQHAAARRGRVLVGGVPFSRARYYTSNRVFFQGSSGVPFVDTDVPGVDRFLRRDDHWMLADDEALVDTTATALAQSDEVLRAMGSRAAAHIFAHHTQAHRSAMVMENVGRLRDIHAGGRAAPHLPFLLDEVDLTAETPLATRGWPGGGPA